MIGIFINMWSINEALRVTLLKEAGSSLRGVAWLLFKELFMPRRIVGAPWSSITTTIADWRYRPLSYVLTHWAS